MSVIARFNPFQDRRNAFPSLFRDFDTLLNTADWQAAASYLIPPSDVLETENAYEVHVDLPGLKPEEINVKLEGDTLTVSAERKQDKSTKGDWHRTERNWGTFARSFVMPDSVVGSSPQAEYESGVLRVVLPKREEAKPKTVQVKVAAK